MSEKIMAKVLSVKNWCYHGYKAGEEMDVSKMKGRGYCVKILGNYLQMLKNGEPLPWENDPEKARVTCTGDYGTVVFELRKTEE
jgi:uncharacterized repeat protein (TIGR04076 family)